MRNARFWRLAVIITAAGGLSVATAGTALAGGGARSDLDVTIGATSAFIPVTGDTLVRYRAPFPAGNSFSATTKPTTRRLCRGAAAKLALVGPSFCPSCTCAGVGVRTWMTEPICTPVSLASV